MEESSNQAAWAICGKGEQGSELWFFEVHLTDDEHSPTGEGWYFASWMRGPDGGWTEYDGGIYWAYKNALELEEVIGETVPFREFSYKDIPYSDFEDICFNGDVSKELLYRNQFGIATTEHRRKEQTYDVCITETLQRTVRVKANSLEGAEARVSDGWKHETHVLGADDFKSVDFKAILHIPSRDQVR